MTAGSLGQGISCAVGMAKAAKFFIRITMFTVLSAMERAKRDRFGKRQCLPRSGSFDNFYLFLDYNKLQLDGYTADINACPNPAERWTAFGFDTQMIDGGDVAAIGDAIEKAKTVTGKPHMIVLDTIKGRRRTVCH